MPGMSQETASRQREQQPLAAPFGQALSLPPVAAATAGCQPAIKQLAGGQCGQP